MPLKSFKANLLPEVKELNLPVKKNILSSAYSGELASNIKGGGIEFEDYREYSVTDDAARIDWRASKRSQRLLVREYKIEVNFTVFFIIDVSETMLFGSTKKLKCEYAAESIASLFHGLLMSGNAVGYALFSDHVTKMLKPMLGRRQFHVFSKDISNPKNYGGKKDIGKAFQQAMQLLDRKSLVFIISDFLGMDDNWKEYFKILSSKHEVIGIMIRDPVDMELPDVKCQLVIGDPNSSNTMYVDSSDYRKIYKEYNEKQYLLVNALFQQNRSTLMLLKTTQPSLHTLMQYFRKKGARWR
ncbi:MAG: DUF58 domain-containing protein [Nanoarchaeota archaeon]|nr:DUF58 domain-containing protein [Nanoarchaeota archaeon]